MMIVVRFASILICFLIASLAFGWWQVDGPSSKQNSRNIPAPLTEMNFQMINHLGAKVAPEQLVGKPTMIFFGFTYCPDICPNTLLDISAWIAALGNEANNLNIVFVTVDPERDNLEAMGEYLANFSPKVEGWIGDGKQLDDATKLFGVTYRRIETENGGYSIDHTSGVYLFDSTGRFARTIDYHESREQALPKIKLTISGK